MPRTILLADDSLAVHRAVEKAFGGRGDRIVVATNGDEAIELLGEDRLDIVLADIHMPGASGYEVARQVAAGSSEIPVLLLVGTFEPVDEERLAASGANGYVLKPFDGAALVARVDELTGVEAPASLPASDSEAPRGAEETEGETGEAGAVAGREAEGEPDDEAAGEVSEVGPADSADTTETAETATGDGASDAAPADLAVTLEDDDVERIARRVVELLTSEVVERLAREVLPEVAERAVRRRIEELESDAE